MIFSSTAFWKPLKCLEGTRMPLSNVPSPSWKGQIILGCSGCPRPLDDEAKGACLMLVARAHTATVPQSMT